MSVQQQNLPINVDGEDDVGIHNLSAQETSAPNEAALAIAPDDARDSSAARPRESDLGHRKNQTMYALDARRKPSSGAPNRATRERQSTVASPRSRPKTKEPLLASQFRGAGEQAVLLRERIVGLVGQAVQDAEGTRAFCSAAVKDRFELPSSDFGDAVHEKLIIRELERLDHCEDELYRASLQQVEVPDVALFATLDTFEDTLKMRTAQFENSAERYRQQVQQDIDEMRRHFNQSVSALQQTVRDTRAAVSRLSTLGSRPVDLIAMDLRETLDRVAPKLDLHLARLETDRSTKQHSLREADPYDPVTNHEKIAQIELLTAQIDSLLTYRKTFHEKIARLKSMCPDLSQGASSVSLHSLVSYDDETEDDREAMIQLRRTIWRVIRRYLSQQLSGRKRSRDE